jgi:hypothetical protein
MSFHPSEYSGLNYARPNTSEVTFETVTSADQASIAASQAKSESWAAGIQAAGALVTTGLTLGFQTSALKKQQEHERKLAKQQEKLIALQTQQINAQGVASQAAAALQGLATTKTLLIVGGVVITFGLIAATVVAVKRGGDDGYYEDEYE